MDCGRPTRSRPARRHEGILKPPLTGWRRATHHEEADQLRAVVPDGIASLPEVIPVDARTRNARWSLALAYLLATVLAHGAHHHHRDAEEAAALCLASCQDARLHLSGHPAPRLNQHLDDCLACQLRADHQAWLGDDRPLFQRPGARGDNDRHPPRTRPESTLRLSCRAPPRA